MDIEYEQVENIENYLDEFAPHGSVIVENKRFAIFFKFNTFAIVYINEEARCQAVAALMRRLGTTLIHISDDLQSI